MSMIYYHGKKRRMKIILLSIALIIAVTMFYQKVTASLENINCKLRLESIGSILKSYHFDYKRLPEYDHWYDILLKYQKGSESLFRCPSCTSKGNIGTYVINRHHNSFWITEPNVVLVFEGMDGWNQSGDAGELKCRHSEGCNILFSDGTVRYVKKDEFAKLNWGINETPLRSQEKQE